MPTRTKSRVKHSYELQGDLPLPNRMTQKLSLGINKPFCTRLMNASHVKIINEF